MRLIDADKLNRKLKRYMKQAEKGDISKLFPEFPTASQISKAMTRATLKRVIGIIDHEPTAIEFIPEPMSENLIIVEGDKICNT